MLGMGTSEVVAMEKKWESRGGSRSDLEAATSKMIGSRWKLTFRSLENSKSTLNQAHFIVRQVVACLFDHSRNASESFGDVISLLHMYFF